MKKVLMIAMFFGAFAAQAATLEGVNVLSITRSGDLMPGPDMNKRSLSYEVVLQVRSNGCTDAKSFSTDFKSTESALVLTITRTVKDTCKAFLPEGSTVTLTIEGPASTKPVQLANPLFVLDHLTF